MNYLRYFTRTFLWMFTICVIIDVITWVLRHEADVKQSVWIALVLALIFTVIKYFENR